MLAVSSFEFRCDSPLDESVPSLCMVVGANSLSPGVVLNRRTCKGVSSFLIECLPVVLIRFFSVLTVNKWINTPCYQI